MRMQYMWGLVGAVAGGMIVGYFIGDAVNDEKHRKLFAEAEASNKRAYEMAAQLEQPKQEVKTLDNVEILNLSLDAEPNAFGESIQILNDSKVEPPKKNPYHTAVEAKDTPVTLFVEGGVNDYGCSYIEEEEYYDEDGRNKYQLTMFLRDDTSIMFLLDGNPCDDWDARVGDSIVVDMINLCPPGQPQILYVRNHRTDEDYEVVRGTP